MEPFVSLNLLHLARQARQAQHKSTVSRHSLPTARIQNKQRSEVSEQIQATAFHTNRLQKLCGALAFWSGFHVESIALTFIPFQNPDASLDERTDFGFGGLLRIAEARLFRFCDGDSWHLVGSCRGIL